MCVALIGGMDRLERHYMNEAKNRGIELMVFTRSEADIGSKIRNMDAVVIFTNMVSHKAKESVMKTARLREIPVYVHHSCGVCSLRDCLNCLIKNGDNRKFQ